MIKKKWIALRMLSIMTAVGILGACSSTDDIVPEKKDPNPVILELDWDTKNNGLYSEADARKDFKNLSSWNSRIIIQDKAVAVKLLANELSGKGGIVSRTNIPSTMGYRLTFDVMFPADFEWGRGGKVGFGLYVGDGNTGCDRADDGNGGSARMMWYTNDNGITKFKPYLYYKDMPGTCGDSFISSAAYPETGSIQKEKWYKISIYVKSNTGADKNGHVTYSVDNKVILDESIRWTTNNAKRMINTLTFATFRGGSDQKWMVDQDTQILFDNLKLEKVN